MGMVIALLGGILFGLGLMVSGMAEPAKVIGFLDVAGSWDPSLSLVMAGAIAFGLPAFRLASRRNSSLLGQPMCLPTAGPIDSRLLLGSAIFGVGWGLAGICPGPGVVMLGIDFQKGGIFILALLAGMALFEVRQAIRANFFAENISN